MATPANLHDESARGLGLATVLEVVRRRRLLALLPCLFVLAAAASMALFLPSLWTAKATVLVNRQEIPEALVRSTVNADPEARLLTLTHQTLDTPRLTKIIQDNDLYPSMRRTRATAEVVERMRKDIKIDVQDERERRGREWRALVFTVGYTHPGHPMLFRWCRRRGIPNFLYGDSNIHGDRARGVPVDGQVAGAHRGRQARHPQGQEGRAGQAA